MGAFLSRLWRSEDAFLRAVRGALASLGTAGLTKFPTTRGEWISFGALFLAGFIGIGDRNAPVNTSEE